MSLTKVIQGMISAGSITAAAVTMATGKLLGRSTAGTGAIEEITIGTGLSLTGGTLSATGGGVSSFNTRTGAITLTTADVNNTIVTGNAVGAVILAAAGSSDNGVCVFVRGNSYSCSGGGIYSGSAVPSNAYADGLTLTGTWKCLDIIRCYAVWDFENQEFDGFSYTYRFQRTA